MSGTEIVVADGNADERERARRMLEEAGFHTRTAASGDETLAQVSESVPALVLAEVQLPDMTGYEVCRLLHDAYGRRRLPVVLMSADRTEPRDGVAARLIGAETFLAKPVDRLELVESVRRTLDRGTRSARNGGSPINDVTPREMDVLALLAEGHDQNEIGRQLGISPKTVATHIQNLLEKLGARSRAHLVALAYRTRLVTLPD